jgi:hypothetical protein
MASPQTSVSQAPTSSSLDDSSSIASLLHSLSNKLLPIVVFSELAIRRCDDSHLKPQIEKIHIAAEQARDLLVAIRTLYGKTEP